MKTLISAKTKFLNLLYKIVSRFLEDIPISAITPEITDVSIKEAWAGKHIEYFPPYDFFRTYLSGKKDQAKKDMERWYYNRLIEDNLCIVPKKQGGMLNGSLFRIVAEIHKQKGINLKTNLCNGEYTLIMQGIRETVERRFKLVDSILHCDYQNTGNPIYLKRTGNRYILINGHHRVAALAACGHSSVMAVTSRPIALKITVKIIKKLRRLNKPTIALTD